MELETFIDVFKFLASPFQSGELTGRVTSGESTTCPEEILKHVTESCRKHIDYLESSKQLLKSEDAASWNLTCIILSMLTKLKTVVEDLELQQTEEEKSIDVLSIQSQIVIQKSVELVVGFGIGPYLLPGVGVPEKLRKMNPSTPCFLSNVKLASPYEQFIRLGHTLEILLICCSHATLNALIVPKYTSDILAGLLQICKSPIIRPKADAVVQKAGALTLEQYPSVMAIRERLQNLMGNTFLVNVPKTSLINSLFLIGAADKPRWISISCNELLGNMILLDNGLIMLSTTMIESAGRSDAWKLMRVISSLMTNALIKTGNPTSRQCLRSLTEQCFYMVNQSHQDVSNSENANDIDKNRHAQNFPFKPLYGFNPELVRVGLFCGLALLDLDFDFVKSLFWNKLFDNLLKLGRCQIKEQSTYSTEAGKTPKELKCSGSFRNILVLATYGELLLSILKPMHVSVPLKLLQPVWSLFLQIFVACETYLQKPVQEPNVAVASEQLHHKLRDVLILLFEIYSSGSGHSLILNSSATNSATLKNSKNNERIQPKESVDLCDFCMLLLLNEESEGIRILNTFDLQCDDKDDQADVQIINVRQVILSSSSDYNQVFEQYLEKNCVCLSQILKNEKLKGIWSQLFRQLLAWGTRKQNKIVREHRTLKSDQMPTLLDGDRLAVSIADCQRFVTFKLLGELGDEEAILEQFGGGESVEETFNFLDLLLNKFTEEACKNSDDLFDSSQLIMYALGIIGALVEVASNAGSPALPHGNRSSRNHSQTMSVDKEINEMWSHLEIFIPHLRKLSYCAHNCQSSLVRQGIPEMASNLLISIGTRGASGVRSKVNDLLNTRFQQAMKDVCSPLVHVKGHGILELRRLIEEKDIETLENEAEVLKVFLQNLDNEDSYVYLMTILGMSALGVKFHKTVIPLLIKEYDFISRDNDKSDSSSDSSRTYKSFSDEDRIETRMKVGEILVKVIQKLGGFAPSYRTQLTNVFFRLMRDEEALIRVSALSNLGELCHLLKFTLGIVLTEVWFCVESILTTEKDIHVRRAALHLLVLLLKGVEKDLSVEDILSDDVLSRYLRDVRRVLTVTEKAEVDLVSKTHCQLALQELELIVKKVLTPRHSLDFIIKI